MRKLLAHILPAILLLASFLPVRAKDQDDKVRLISAKTAQLIEKDGQNFRKVVGPAKFLHNNTYLLCDTALWNVTTNIIDAVGHVRIIQDQTKLSSATLQYVVDENMAKFRGSLVQLEDKDKNTLRTRYLDYNTKDSVAIFQGGAAMRDKDGQVIESLYGTYDSKAHLFVFNDKVNMYMDTTFVKTSRLEYRSDLSTAYFGYGTDMWQDDKMLSANDGWYDRGMELFFFRRNVHLLSKDQEAWTDTLYYQRAVNNVEMLGHVELMDTTRNVYALAGRFEYTDSLSEVRMTREPAIISVSEEETRRGGIRKDTLYMGADLLRYRTYKRCDIPAAWQADANKRLKDISGDPVMEYRKKAAEAAAKAAEEAAKKDPNRQPPKGAAPGKEKDAEPEKPKAPEKPKETGKTAVKSPGDTLPPPPDTSKVTFLWGSKRVRMFRRDMQMSSDSLTYNDLDSLVRVYQDPIFYNEGDRQYTADSIYLVVRNRAVEKAHLLSNAFITIQEEVLSFDQIRGAEMVAYFDSTSALTRFDALGGASSLFFLEENGALATVNKVDSKMIYATFKKGNIEKMYYYDNPKNDGYPTVQLPSDEKELKGFRWEPERRPASPQDITTLVPRESERFVYLARPHADFKQTEIYFPGHIRKIYRDIAIRDSLDVVREQLRRRRQDSLARVKALIPEADTLFTQADTLLTQTDTLLTQADTLLKPAETRELPPVVEAPADTVLTPANPHQQPPVEVPAPADTLTLPSPADTLLTPVDTTALAPLDSLAPPLTPAEIKAREKAEAKARREEVRLRKLRESDARRREKEAARRAKEAEQEKIEAEKQAVLEAQWAVQDSLYAAKQAVKAEKKLQKERARKLKILRRREKKAQKERKIFERYLHQEQQKAIRRKNRKHK